VVTEAFVLAKMTDRLFLTNLHSSNNDRVNRQLTFDICLTLFDSKPTSTTLAFNDFLA